MESVVGVGGGDVEEGDGSAGEELAGALHGDDGVVEGGGVGVVGDGVDFFALLGHAGFDGGLVVGVFDLVEGGGLEGECGWERKTGSMGRRQGFCAGGEGGGDSQCEDAPQFHFVMLLRRCGALLGGYMIAWRYILPLVLFGSKSVWNDWVAGIGLGLGGVTGFKTNAVDAT